MKLKKLMPNMIVNDVRETVEFYGEILGFKLNMAVPENTETIENELKEDKTYSYAMVSRDEVCIMFVKKGVFEEDRLLLKDEPIGGSVSFYIDVDDVNEIYSSVKDRADIVIDLRTAWYGMEEFYMRDCNGYILGFAEKK
ncbi:MULTISPECIES: VOC family protein [Psychrilyobacter]|uniref:Bleomycin resistance family protein n=1 Tax=Psychrilyobacter piezotolerans TaxID=2293438 RepID=A0ABX9KEB8_9FUSO|nr:MULTISPECIES: VOC family protein [Psychrilyobacter]MCS5422240.1 VOC family protein [Psychrilyobacter sp. S5]NDI78754.1 bleomycin resistance family protein [Psychrilyobacter piezotolerans]RDE59603.1 bleomycin resistance family protein [Psychrilyobacter sp. S5]REI40017.1 bleomycin resistance family protein [Psychrilyobacter piezotolerans]